MRKRKNRKEADKREKRKKANRIGRKQSQKRVRKRVRNRIERKQIIGMLKKGGIEKKKNRGFLIVSSFFFRIFR